MYEPLLHRVFNDHVEQLDWQPKQVNVHTINTAALYPF
ncbi:hypothetical protein EVAR_66276_1, partial [Eumeta japonica]